MFDWILLIVAFCGGIFGAAVGIVPAFICVGFVGIPGIAAGIAGSTFDWHGLLTFGPFFGPHISFASACAAAAYARKRGYIQSGKDGALSLMGLGKPDVLVVGGIFGILGYIVHSGIVAVASQGQTDTVALSVVITSLVAKVIFGDHGIKEIFGVLSDEAKARGRFAVGGNNRWCAFQDTMGQKVIIAIGAGGLSAYVTQIMLGGDAATASQAVFVGFCISAVSLIFLQGGQGTPITHHITITAAYTIAAGGNIFWGIAMAIIASQLCDILGRLFYIHGDTHVDPPACAICSGAFLVYLLKVAGIFKVGGSVLPLIIIAVFVAWGIFDFRQQKAQQGAGIQG